MRCWIRFCNPRRTGFTLVEVLAAVLLAGTLLAAVLTATRLHSRQLRTAERKQAAVETLDGLLESWHQSPARKPGSTGRISGTPAWRWSRRVIQRPTAASPFQLVRVELFALDQPGPPLAMVELLEGP